jgi:hypothetical protein
MYELQITSIACLFNLIYFLQRILVDGGKKQNILAHSESFTIARMPVD